MKDSIKKILPPYVLNSYRSMRGSVLKKLIAIKNPYWSDRGHLKLSQARLIVAILRIVKPKNVLEIGFATGRSASTILVSSRPRKFISVEIDLDYAEPEGRKSAEILQEKFPNFIVIEGSSQKMLTEEFFKSKFEGGVDFAFVDGGHSYEECRADLVNVYPHLTSEGCILVDDYMSDLPEGVRMDSVTKAVDDFAIEEKLNKVRWFKRGSGCALLFRDPLLINAFKKIDGVISFSIPD